jgi:hypothetical protein
MEVYRAKVTTPNPATQDHLNPQTMED